jgi:hypothetical protein
MIHLHATQFIYNILPRFLLDLFQWHGINGHNKSDITNPSYPTELKPPTKKSAGEWTSFLAIALYFVGGFSSVG